MTGLVIPAGQGELTIDGISMSTPAWLTTDLSPLWAFPEVRGSDVVIPGIAGQRAYPRVVDETVYRLQMVIIGDVDQDGAPHADPNIGIVANLDYLWDNVVSPPAGTRAATLEMPDGSSRTADVHVGLVVGDSSNTTDKPAVLFLTVPAGRFTAAEVPSNDNWADATELDVETDTVVTADNTGFTIEADEQMPAIADVIRTAWWKFTAPADGTVDLDTNGTPFDTVLAVWTGASLAALVEEDSDDDGGIAPNSALSLSVTDGTTYYVQVGAFTSADPSEGEITLNISWTP